MLVQVFASWVDAATAEKHGRMLCNKLFAKQQRDLLCKAVRAWQQHAADLHLRREAAEKLHQTVVMDMLIMHKTTAFEVRTAFIHAPSLS